VNPKLLLGLGVVAGGGYLFWKHQEKVRAVANKVIASDTVQHARIPKPLYVMTIPRTDEDLDTLDIHLCDCMSERGDLPGLEDEDTIIEQLRDCTAAKLYPDFPWPPIAGDHETVHQLWLIIEYRIRSLANTDSLDALCAEKPTPKPIPVPQK